MKKENKKQVAKITIFLTSIFVIFLSVTYAFINVTINGTRRQVITVGNLNIDLEEDDNFTIDNTLPVYDEVGMLSKSFDFRLINNSDEKASYTLSLEDITTGERLSFSDVKLGLTKNGETSIDLLDTLENLVIDTGLIGGNETIEYSLRLWIRDSVTDNEIIQGKSLKFRIQVSAEQIPKEIYTESILNGADPILSDNLIPVTIENDGTVHRAVLYDKWYSYEEKLWANAVVLLDKTVTYENGEVIPEENIESYFVWIPRYKYKIFNDTAYTGATNLENRVQEIEVEFEGKTTPISNGTKKDEWLTHPAFTSFDTNGFWVGKFESGYKGATSTETAQVNSSDSTKLQIKPDVYSWRNITVGNAFKVSYDYLREDESHMMKNMEWGSVAYLQHSRYGSMMSVRANNNNSYKTGYASISEPTLGYNKGTSIEGNLNGINANVTLPYNTPTGYNASTTGNITGIYDTSGGAWEYVMGYNVNASAVGGDSGLTNIYGDFFTNNKWKKYYDQYSNTVMDGSKYQTGLLGDATREIGPFGKVQDPDGSARYRMSWHGDLAYFVLPNHPWFERGGDWYHGVESGAFAFSYGSGGVNTYISFRVVLAPQS